MYCEQCGNKLKEGDCFCEVCGAFVSISAKKGNTDRLRKRNKKKHTFLSVFVSIVGCIPLIIFTIVVANYIGIFDIPFITETLDRMGIERLVVSRLDQQKKEDDRSFYDKLSEKGKVTVDQVLANSYIWEQQDLNRVYFNDSGLVVRTLVNSNSAIGTYVWKYFFYSMDGGVCTGVSDIEIINYSLSEPGTVERLTDSNYGIDWGEPEKRERISEEYYITFEKQE